MNDLDLDVSDVWIGADAGGVSQPAWRMAASPTTSTPIAAVIATTVHEPRT